MPPFTTGYLGTAPALRVGAQSFIPAVTGEIGDRVTGMRRQHLAWVTFWENGLLWFSSHSSWFAPNFQLSWIFPFCFFPTPICIPSLLPKQILITYWRASPEYFQLCQGALELLCSPAGAACCSSPAPSPAPWFQGQCHAALGHLVTCR